MPSDPTVPGDLPPLALELAALLACGENSFISHRSAAFVWGLRTRPPTQVEVSVVDRSCDSRNGICVHRIRKIHRAELRRHEGLWISSPARAALEVAAGATGDDLADLVTGASRDACPRRASSKAVLARHRGRRGVARLAEVLGSEDAMTITRSQG